VAADLTGVGDRRASTLTTLDEVIGAKLAQLGYVESVPVGPA
jgi:hypothetical protein